MDLAGEGAGRREEEAHPAHVARAAFNPPWVEGSIRCGEKVAAALAERPAR